MHLGFHCCSLRDSMDWLNSNAPLCLSYHLPLVDLLRESVHISIKYHPIEVGEDFFTCSSQQVLRNSLESLSMDPVNAYNLV